MGASKAQAYRLPCFGGRGRCRERLPLQASVTRLGLPPVMHAGNEAVGAAGQQAVRRQPGQVSRLEAPGQLTGRRRLAADGPAHLQVGMPRHQRLQFLAEGTLGAVAHVVQQGHRRVEATGQGLAQQAEQGRDAATGGQQQHRGCLLWPVQIALGRLQLQHGADCHPVQQPVGQPPLRLALDRQFETPVLLHAQQAVAAALAHAIQLQVEAYVLAGAPATGIGIGAQTEGEHVLGHPAAGFDAGEHAIEPQDGMDEAQQAVQVGFLQPAAAGQRAQGAQRGADSARQGERYEGHNKTLVNSCALGCRIWELQSTVVH